MFTRQGPREQESVHVEEKVALQRAATLAEIGGTNEYVGGKVWTGTISIDTRGDISAAEANAFLEEKLASVEWVPTNMQHAMRCPDGRPNKGTEDKVRNGKTTRSVGPQIFGGTPGCALAARVIENGDFSQYAFTNDVAKTTEFLKQRGIAFGGHKDEHAHGDKCGCGAIDQIPAVLGVLGNDELAPTIQKLTAAIIGEEYSADTGRGLFMKFENLNRQADHYLERQGETYPYRRQVLQIMENESTHPEHAIQTMVGPHNEVALVVNKKRNTTLNRAKLNVETDRKFQVFNFDYWACEELAKAYYPKSPEKQREWLHARVMQSVATAMVLTDGSLPVYVRQ